MFTRWISSSPAETGGADGAALGGHRFPLLQLPAETWAANRAGSARITSRQQELCETREDMQRLEPSSSGEPGNAPIAAEAGLLNEGRSRRPVRLGSFPTGRRVGGGLDHRAVRGPHLASWWWWVSVRKRHLQWWFACCLFRSAAFSRFSISMERYSTLCLVSSSRNRSRPRVALCRADEAIQVGPHRASGSPVGPLLHSTQQYRHGRSARVVRNSKGGLRE